MKFLLFLGLIGVGVAAIVKRASNSYGDEPIGAVEGGGAQLSANVAPEQASSRARQSYSTYTSGVQSSGYRKKRASNSYGDEAVMPQGGGAQDPYKPMVEHESAQVQQYPTRTASVVSSGYRAKRNSYGDEAVTPATPAPGEGAQSYHEMEEKPAVAVEQNVKTIEKVQSSGY